MCNLVLTIHPAPACRRGGGGGGGDRETRGSNPFHWPDSHFEQRPWRTRCNPVSTQLSFSACFEGAKAWAHPRPCEWCERVPPAELTRARPSLYCFCSSPSLRHLPANGPSLTRRRPLALCRQHPRPSATPPSRGAAGPTLTPRQGTFPHNDSFHRRLLHLQLWTSSGCHVDHKPSVFLKALLLSRSLSRSLPLSLSLLTTSVHPPPPPPTPTVASSGHATK